MWQVLAVPHLYMLVTVTLSLLIKCNIIIWSAASSPSVIAALPA